MTTPSGMQWIKGEPETAVVYLASGNGYLFYADMPHEQQAIVRAFVEANDPFEPYEP